MDIETTFYEYLKKYAENKTSVKCFNLKHISLLPPDYAWYVKVLYVYDRGSGCEVKMQNRSKW